MVDLVGRLVRFSVNGEERCILIEHVQMEYTNGVSSQSLRGAIVNPADVDHEIYETVTADDIPQPPPSTNPLKKLGRRALDMTDAKSTGQSK